jgi:hypothetical protein
MGYLGQPYYVGLLSAAAIHGSSHQQPMVFQVMTSVPTREVRVGKVAIRFSMNSNIEQMPVAEKQTETGTMRVATPETTAFDLIRYQAGAGHLSNASSLIRSPSGSKHRNSALSCCVPESRQTARSTGDGTSGRTSSWRSTFDPACQHHRMACPRTLASQRASGAGSAALPRPGRHVHA